VLTDAGDGHAARITAAHRRADRTTLELNVDGQSDPVELDLPMTSNTPALAAGDDVAIKPLRYRVYPLQP
jgi:sulfate transport system ATP-binding protein